MRCGKLQASRLHLADFDRGLTDFDRGLSPCTETEPLHCFMQEKHKPSILISCYFLCPLGYTKGVTLIATAIEEEKLPGKHCRDKVKALNAVCIPFHMINRTLLGNMSFSFSFNSAGEATGAPTDWLTTLDATWTASCGATCPEVSNVHLKQVNITGQY